jgi:hypothetical protein
VSYDIDILINIPGRDLYDVIESNFSGEQLDPGPVDLLDVAARIGPLLSGDADVDASAASLAVVDRAGRLHIDLTPEGGQINLPLNPSTELLELAQQLVSVVCAGTNLFGFDPQRERRFDGWHR